jgi:hypothetical protein
VLDFSPTGWVAIALARNLGLTVVYYEFWYHTLYRMRLADRKFKPHSFPSAGVVWRNRFWTLMVGAQKIVDSRCCVRLAPRALAARQTGCSRRPIQFAQGAVQWTVWESLYFHMFATGRLPFVADAAMLATWQNALRMLLWTMFTPIVRRPAVPPGSLNPRSGAIQSAAY